MDFGCKDVEFLVDWMLDLVYGCCILIGWILNSGLLDDGFWLYRCLILVDGCWIWLYGR